MELEAGLLNNIFKTDQRIDAENRVSELRTQGIDAIASRNRKAGGWDVSYGTNEKIDLGDGSVPLSGFA